LTEQKKDSIKVRSILSPTAPELFALSNVQIPMQRIVSYPKYLAEDFAGGVRTKFDFMSCLNFQTFAN